MKIWRRRALPPEQVLGRLPERFRSALLSMYAGGPQRGSDGELHAIDSITRIGPREGMWLYELCRKAKAAQTAEVGLAYGFSTIYFLAAIHENAGATHTAIDPFQLDYWHGVGLHQSEKLGVQHALRFINDKSSKALADLAHSHTFFDVIFIDGNHRFDDVLVDFTLSAELCPPGGHIVLDDVSLPSIRRVVSFIERNRSDFEKVETPRSSMAAFRRTGDDARDWRHYVAF